MQDSLNCPFEATLSDIQRSLKRLDPETSRNLYSPNDSQSSRPSSSYEYKTPPPQTSLANFRRPVGHCRSVHNGTNDKRYFGPTSLESLMHHTKTLVIQPLQTSKPEVEKLSEAVLLAHDKIESLLGRDDGPIQDGCAPTIPPHSVLEAMIEPYFSTINPYFPIWTKKHFVRFSIASQYSKNPEQDRAYITCSNNLILMTLAATSLRSRSAQQAHFVHQSRSSSVDFDLIRTFLTNAKRAIKNIELLLSPHLINVQALLSLVSYQSNINHVTNVNLSMDFPLTSPSV